MRQIVIHDMLLAIYCVVCSRQNAPFDVENKEKIQWQKIKEINCNTKNIKKPMEFLMFVFSVIL